jgi:hypothetical protein
MNAPFSAREAARAAVWSRDAEKLQQVLDAMAHLHGRWVDAIRSTAEAAVAALDGRREEAVSRFERAIDAWTTLRSPLDLAFAAIGMAHVLPDEDATRDAVDQARRTLVEIGAVTLLGELDSLTGATAVATPTRSEPLKT